MNYKNFKKKNKKFIWCSVLVAAVLVLALSVFFVSKAMKENKGYRTISVVETSGNVTVVKNGIDYSAYPGMHLQEGHVLVTGGDSTVRLVLDGDKYVKVESGSRVVFETLGFLGSKKTKMNLERGAITAELVNPLEDGQEFIVNTPNAVLAVRGTFFRVSLEMSELGEIRANVMTYGGMVTSRRIFPTGEVEEKEVPVSAGYMTAIHMDDADTVYVVDGMKDAVDTDGDERLDIAPIQVADISDDDLVDIYYSAENGHELFITAQEAKADIDNRNIDIENEVSVYQKAAQVVPEEMFAGAAEDIGAGLRIVIDDGEPLLAEAETDHSEGGENDSVEPEEPVEPETEPEDSASGPADESVEPEEPVSSEAPEEESEEEPDAEPVETEEPMDDTETTEHMHIKAETRVEATCQAAGWVEEVCSVCGIQISWTELPMLEHTPEYAGSEDVHSECANCGITLSTEHEYTDEVTEEATCTKDGVRLYSCECGYSYEKPIPATGHTVVAEQNPATCQTAGWKKEVCSVCGTQLSQTELPMTGHTSEYVGSETIHSRCAHCGMTLSTAHEFTDEVTREATCTEDGIWRYSCVCGYSYDIPITASGHTPENGGEEEAHSVCATCDEVLEDGSYHNLVETGRTEATCTSEGQVDKECACGYTKSETIPAAAHQYEESTGTCSTCGLPMVAINSTNFPDAKFRTYVGQFDTDNDGYLYSTELTQVTTIDVEGTSSADGGYTSLQGITYFTQLNMLKCSYNANITELDLRLLTNLETLTVEGCNGLVTLNISNTRVFDLSLYYLTNLTTVYADNCTNLSLVAAHSCPSLTQFSASGCYSEDSYRGVYSVNLSSCTNLQTVNVSGNRAMYDLNLDRCTGLTSVNVTNCGNISQVFTVSMRQTGKTTSIITGFDSGYMIFHNEDGI